MDERCFLVDFFFVDAVAEEVACCGAGAVAKAMPAARVDVTHGLAASARSSDAAIGCLIIFLRCSSPPGVGFFE